MKRSIPLFLMVSFISGCRFWLDPGVSFKHDQPNFVYMPDMAYSPAVKAQEPDAVRLPVKGTIPREKLLVNIPETQDEAAQLKNPFKKTLANLKRGQELFNIYCIVCHGPLGEGNGSVVPKLAQPPSLQSDKIRGYYANGQEGGRVFHIISKGQNRMSSYSTQVQPMDRWKIAMYIQALHRAKNPTEADLKAYEGQ